MADVYTSILFHLSFLSSTAHFFFVTGWPTVLEFLEFLELFWNFFGTGNVLEKSHFFRLVLELFLNSEFLTSDFLGYNISRGCLDLPFVRKYYFSFAQLFVLEKCENVLEMFWNCSGIF